MKYFLVHDLGTSGNKTTLFAFDGKVIASDTTNYPTQYLAANGVEQNPEDWWHAVCISTRNVLAKINPNEIAAVSLSGHMQGAVCLSRDGDLLHPSLIWMDQRSENQTKQLINEMSLRTIYGITGHRASSVYTLEKIMWLKDNKPEVYNRIYKVINTKDYIIFRLTGEILTDYSDASGTNALNIHQKCWSDEILYCAGINREIMPQLMESTEIAGYITQEAFEACGLLKGTPVICGGGDGACATVGAGSVDDNSMYCCMGTSAWIASTESKPLLDENMTLFNFVHMIKGKYIPCGAMSSCGISYEWALDVFARLERRLTEENQASIHDLVEQEVSRISAGSNGILFLPYLHGERSPRWNPNARGVLFGLNSTHTSAEMIRSVMEGVAYNLNLIRTSFNNHEKVHSLTLIGGGTNKTWTQILSDVFNKQIYTIRNNKNATAIGAATAAGIGIGEYQDFSSVNQFIVRDVEFIPINDNAEIYHDRMALFDKIYRSVEGLF